MRGILLIPLIVLAAPSPALAHGGLLEGQNPLTVWNITPFITIATLLTVWFYFNGIRRWKQVGLRISPWRQVSFYTGISLIYLALQSPIDPISDHLFFFHQIEHLMIRMLGPFLLVLSLPQAPILKGFPAWGRKYVAKPVIRQPEARWLYRFLTNPIVATLVFVGSLYIWQIPALHDASVLNETLHEVMHFNMVMAGLFFWWLIVDPREAVSRVTYGVRLLMLLAGLMTNIPLGAYLTFKEQTLYQAYDIIGRLWGFTAAADEQQGGLIQWVPGSMMFVVGALVVLRMLYIHEEREAAQYLKPA